MLSYRSSISLTYMNFPTASSLLCSYSSHSPTFIKKNRFKIMGSLNVFNRRVERTREWLNIFIHESAPTRRNTSSSNESITEEFELLHLDDTVTSDFGMKSLSERCPSNDQGSSLENNSARTSSQSVVSTPSIHPSYWTDCDIWDSILSFALHARQGFEDEDILDQKQAIDYELCGRGCDNTFRDLRSACKARKRKRRELEKYYFWKEVKPGWLGQQTNDARGSGKTYLFGGLFMAPPEQLTTVTKKMMYQEAQLYPRPPTYHRSTKKPWLRACPARLERAWEERKHARQHVLDGLDDDLDQCIPCLDIHYGDDLQARGNDQWDWNRKVGWCYICGVPWGYCAGYGPQFEIDQIESLKFEPGVEGNTWTLDWTVGHGRLGHESNRGPAVLPYQPSDWVLHDYPECYRHDDVRI